MVARINLTGGHRGPPLHIIMKMDFIKSWTIAIRPKTLPAAIAPVAMATAMAAGDGIEHLPTAGLCLLGALAIQIGTNLANDYFDFQKGADTVDRLGPTRVTQAGLIKPLWVLIGGLIFFFIAAVIAYILVQRGGRPIAIIGILSVLSGILYTAGPFALGLIAVLLYGYQGPKSLKSCVQLAALTIFILALIILLVGFEGLICIAMALPIGLVLAVLGGVVGYFIQRRQTSQNDARIVILILIGIIPLLMGAEYAVQPKPAILCVKSYVNVNAPEDIVWRNVVSFSVLPEPQDILFRAGIAYPTHAEIKGVGVGAVRECHFSTGSFIEPITVWDENRLLRFDVVAQPPPMKELSPYKNIHPLHLDNYLVSQRGQFLLTKLPDGKIRLEGTTWYYNKMWPESYWQLWSDHIIHQIHLRVLNHIKNISERKYE